MTNNKRIIGWGLLLLFILMPFSTEAAPKKELEFTEVKLNNGITLKYKVLKDEPLVSMYTVFPIGMNKEKTKGIAHLMEHLVFRGGYGYGFGDIAAVTSRKGGYFNGFTSFDVTAYNYVSPKEKFEEAFKVFNGSIWNTDLSETLIALERKIVVHELDMDYEGHLPYYPVYRYFYPEISYTKETVDAISAQDLREFHQTYYQPGNATYILAGDFDPQIVIAQLEQVTNGFGESETPKEDLVEFNLPVGEIVEKRNIYPYHYQLLMGYEMEGISEADRMVIKLLAYNYGLNYRIDYYKNQYKFYYTITRTLGNKDFFGIYYLERDQEYSEENLMAEKERMINFFRQFKKGDFKEQVTNFIELIELEQVSSVKSAVDAVEYELQRLLDGSITVDDLPVLKNLSVKDLERVMQQYFSKPPQTWILVNNQEEEGKSIE
ncbi:MAG: insulinase family protein [Firmicutes bacterium]|nr:insulinase family protein [Bacillota bacterium]